MAPLLGRRKEGVGYTYSSGLCSYIRTSFVSKFLLSFDISSSRLIKTLHWMRNNKTGSYEAPTSCKHTLEKNMK